MKLTEFLPLFYQTGSRGRLGLDSQVCPAAYHLCLSTSLPEAPSSSAKWHSSYLRKAGPIKTEKILSFLKNSKCYTKKRGLLSLSSSLTLRG